MQHAVILAFLAAVSASAPSRTPASNVWQITNFHAGSLPGESMEYALNVTDGYSSTSCATENSHQSPTCGTAQGPYSFTDRQCSNQMWSWELSSSQSPTNPPTPGFILKISLSQQGAETVYGCRFVDYNITCTTDPNDWLKNTLTWNVPPAFNITDQTSSECKFV